MSSLLFLIRHGETAWNSEGVFRGRSDIPLNKRGLQQAKATADYLKSVDFTAVYCSPLTRSIQTADAICLDRAIKPTPVTAFTDISFGPWEGKSFIELEALYPEAIETWQKRPEKHKLPDAETLNEAMSRSFNQMELLAHENQGKNIAIVSHRVILKLLILAALRLDSKGFWKIKQDTCCINMLEFEDKKGFVVVKINETCHLHLLVESYRKHDF
ncbi:MAG: histidine phosphatase family protein [Bacillota bacterium]